MDHTFSPDEFRARIARFHETICRGGEDWDAAFIFDRVSRYYFTGTAQDGLFVLKRDGSYSHFIRKSYERAKTETQIEPVFPLASYRDVTAFVSSPIRTLLVDANVATLAHLQRLEKHFKIERILPVDTAIQVTRSVKSETELAIMRESGRLHHILLESVVPALLREGMNEAELTAALYQQMVGLGYHGVSRFSMFQTEMVVGQVAFGENSIYPTSFDGPGGMKGLSAAVPIIGDRERCLKKGDLVFIDIGFGCHGYHSDRTQVYMYGVVPSSELSSLHNQCLAIEKQAAKLLRPGNAPSEIYAAVIGRLDKDFLSGFMGLPGREVKFLGHGVGLHIDEYPVIARGFDAPLEKNMVMALEPKKAVPGIGMVGVEDTYIVTEQGGECITFGEKDIMVV